MSVIEILILSILLVYFFSAGNYFNFYSADNRRSSLCPAPRTLQLLQAISRFCMDHTLGASSFFPRLQSPKSYVQAVGTTANTETTTLISLNVRTISGLAPPLAEFGSKDRSVLSPAVNEKYFIFCSLDGSEIETKIYVHVRDQNRRHLDLLLVSPIGEAQSHYCTVMYIALHVRLYVTL